MTPDTRHVTREGPVVVTGLTLSYRVKKNETTDEIWGKLKVSEVMMLAHTYSQFVPPNTCQLYMYGEKNAHNFFFSKTCFFLFLLAYF